MAKALLGYMSSDLHTAQRLAAENRRLLTRIGDLEALVVRLQDENDKLTTTHAEALLEPIEEMQPA